jgi:hypothetical protein
MTHGVLIKIIILLNMKNKGKEKIIPLALK